MTFPESRVNQVEREDLVLFINASFACSGQREFHGNARDQSVSIEFLHAYVLGNYRRLYARTLAAGINHFNQGLVIANLLAAGSPGDAGERREEGELIFAALARLPPNRVFALFVSLRRRHVNNRRTRAVLRRYLLTRPDPAFHAVKYRSKLRKAITHTHLHVPKEMGEFLFGARRGRKFKTPIYETFRKALHAKSAVYELPFTVAQGLAARHQIEPGAFLAGIAPRMTAAEKGRSQEAARKVGLDLEVDLLRMPLTRLALYLLRLPTATRLARREELEAALATAAARVLRRSPLALGRVAAVLDRSYSSSGSSEKRRRPLAIALATGELLRAAARDYRAFWTLPTDFDLGVTARGQSGLGDPLIAALEWRPDLVVIVSDGFENDPPAGAAEVARVYRERIDPAGTVEILHLNPVFDAENYVPRAIGAAIPTVGVRDAEDVPTMLSFARFATGRTTLAELHAYFQHRLDLFLTGARA